MKVLLLRLGVLGTLVVLGWMTVANAQRGSDNVNPLRAAPPVTEAATAPGAMLRPADSIPDAATIGLSPPQSEPPPQCTHAPSHNPRVVVSTSAVQPVTGPELISGGPSRPADNRYAAPSEGRYGVSSQNANRYSPPPISAGGVREPRAAAVSGRSIGHAGPSVLERFGEHSAAEQCGA